MRDPRAPNLPPLWRCLLAALSGVLLTLSFPGGGSQAWLAFVALVPLLVAIDGVGPRAGATLGFANGCALWTVTLAWPVPWVAQSGGVTWAGAGLTLLVVVVASLWVALELVRSRVLTGFPWNLLGASQFQRHALIQVATVTGVYGVSFVVAAVNAATARLVTRARDVRDTSGAAAAAVTIVAAALAVGWLAPARMPDTKPIPVAIVQGDIDQATKWNAAYVERTLAIHRALTLEAVRNGARLVVWPETTVPLAAVLRSAQHGRLQAPVGRSLRFHSTKGTKRRVRAMYSRYASPKRPIFSTSSDLAVATRAVVATTARTAETGVSD